MVATQEPAQRRRTPLSRERVLQVAIELADREGTDALSMRKLGQELGVDAMALYRHVRNKDDLLDGIIGLLIGEMDGPRPEGEWKAALRTQLLRARVVMLRHPWARRVFEDRGASGLAVVAYVESILAIMREGEVSIPLAHHAIHALGSRLFGFSQDLFDESGPEPSAEEAAILSRAMADRFPRVTELALSASHDGVLGKCDDDFEFAFAIDLIIDGLERLRGS